MEFEPVAKIRCLLEANGDSGEVLGLVKEVARGAQVVNVILLETCHSHCSD